VGVSRKSPGSLTLGLDDARTLGPATRPVGDGEEVLIIPVGEIPSRVFDKCPICGSAADSDEHVPPQSMGGRVVTRTCGLCNHRLGSNVEKDVKEWFDVAITLPRFSSSTVRGARGAGRLLLRRTAACENLLLVDGHVDPDIIGMLRSGDLAVAGLLPDENRWRLALLKCAYLGYCMVDGVPTGRIADRVRAQLIAARDADGPSSVPFSDLAMGLLVSRQSEPAADIPPLVYAVAREPKRDLPGVLLAGCIFVAWHFWLAAGQVPSRELSMGINVVGPKIDGTILSVNG
jgi:hypothetical protein